jgi:hypothetical protein
LWRRGLRGTTSLLQRNRPRRYEEALLPRYFFNLYNDEFLRDEVGEYFDGPEDARKAAARTISELIAEQIVNGKTINLRHRVEVESGDGEIAFTVPFSDFFQVPDNSCAS